MQAEKGGYSHFMLKEIHEQPRADRRHAARAGSSRAGGDVPSLDGLDMIADELERSRIFRGLRHLLARRPGRQVT